MTSETQVVFVESYPQVIAGQQRTLLSLLAETAHHGIRPLVMVPDEGVYAQTLRTQGYDVEVLRYPASLSRYGGAIYRDSIAKRLRVLRDTATYVLSIRRRLKQIRPAAVFCNDMRGLLTVGVAAKSLGIPNITWDKLDKPHGILDWFQLPLVAKNPIISWPVAEKYPRWQRRWYRDRIVRVPNGVELSRFDGVVPIRESLGFAPDDQVLALVGTVTHRKGQDLLLSVFPEMKAMFPKLHLLLVGSWEDSEQDRQYYHSLPNRTADGVHFLGQRNDIPALMRSIDALVIPSRYEGLGQVTLEAMACGKPVVGTRVGGIAETVVQGETGFLFAKEDTQDLKQCLAKILSEPTVAAAMGSRGFDRVSKEYRREEKMAQICGLIGEVAGGRRKLD